MFRNITCLVFSFFVIRLCWFEKHNKNNKKMIPSKKSFYCRLDNCSHIFHPDCILEQSKHQNKCPLCLKEFQSLQYRHGYHIQIIYVQSLKLRTEDYLTQLTLSNHNNNNYHHIMNNRRNRAMNNLFRDFNENEHKVAEPFLVNNNDNQYSDDEYF